MAQQRVMDFDDGVAMVITDLHGEGWVYRHLRDKFLRLHENGEVQRLIICGDLIHGYGSEAEDASLDMLMDVMRLQEAMGDETIIMLLGNHEMPHIYSVTLAKGEMEFTPRFEKFLVRLDKRGGIPYCRDDVIHFLKSLPIYVRTQAGVLLTHAGASPAVKTREDGLLILDYDHDVVLQQGDMLLEEYPIEELRDNLNYNQRVNHLMGIASHSDERYTDLIRGILLRQNSGKFEFLWDVLFTTSEKDWSEKGYAFLLQVFLQVISELSPIEQKVLVAGHIGTRGGHQIVADQHLRLSTYAHAHPNEAGQYLLLDCASPVKTAEDLVPHLYPTFDS